METPAGGCEVITHAVATGRRSHAARRSRHPRRPGCRSFINESLLAVSNGVVSCGVCVGSCGLLAVAASSRERAATTRVVHPSPLTPVPLCCTAITTASSNGTIPVAGVHPRIHPQPACRHCQLISRPSWHRLGGGAHLCPAPALSGGWQRTPRHGIARLRGRAREPCRVATSPSRAEAGVLVDLERLNALPAAVFVVVPLQPRHAGHSIRQHGSPDQPSLHQISRRCSFG